MDNPGQGPGTWRDAHPATRCAYCGTSVSAGADRCAHCGRPIGSDEALTPPLTPADDLLTIIAPAPASDEDAATVAFVPAAADDAVTMVVSSEQGSDEDALTIAAPSDPDHALTIAAVSDSLADAMTVATPAPSTAPPARPGSRRAGGDGGPLEVGQSFGPRYHIIRLLGAGGMGAVYQAWDAELGVAVAIKVIRPDVMADPVVGAEVARRFKRELLLARQVTHKNVVRIHDLGDIDGIKYITMSYVDGIDLATILKQDGKQPVEKVLHVARSVISGLVAAHTAGVVHRDLKPANIMLDKDGEALIMDFGIAHSTGEAEATASAAAADGSVPENLRRAASVHAATTVGAVVGTLEYMAPEQAKGQAVDQRVDVYAFGLILYDILLGRRRASSGQSAMDELQRRMKSPPPPLQALAPDIPAPVAALVGRCVEPEADKRFQTSADVAAELDRLDDAGQLIPIKKTIGLPQMAAIVAVLSAVFGGAWWYFREVPVVIPDPVLVAIADFDNQTGDPDFDHTIEPIVRRGLDDATFITSYDRTRLRSTFGVEPPEKLGESEAQAIARNQGLGVVVSGALSRQGNGYAISVRATRAIKGEVVVAATRTAARKDQVIAETGSLIAAVRTALGDTTSDREQMFAMKTMTATRLDVARYYAAAFEAQSDGKLEETIKNLEAAIALDPNTSGLGYQGLAVIARNLDKVDEAKQYIKQALSHLGGMTTRERLATRGVNAIIEGSPESCVQEYGVLLSTYSADAMSRNQRGLCLSKLRKMREAVGEMQQAVKLLPKRPLFRANLALYAAYGGDFQTAQQQALEIKEPYDYATLAVAFAQLGRGSLTEAAQTYEKLAGVSLRGASWSALGLGDIELYRGRYTEAIRILEKGAAADLKTEFPERAARKQISIGYAHFLRGETTQAIAAADKALRTSTSAEVQFLAARVLIEAGETTRAQPIADALATQFPSEPHTYGKILQGEIALKTGDARRAIALLTEANDQSKGGLDTWLGHFALGRAYLAVEQYVDADSQFDQCLQRKGEALALLVDESPTFGYFPMVYYYQGQVREALKTSGYAAAYREYLKIRGDSTEDRLVPEVRRRAG